VSSGAESESESDDGPEFGRGDESSVPEQRSTPEHLVDNTVTRIMPIIAPWPKPGAEPPTPSPPTPRAVGAAPVAPRSDASDPVEPDADVSDMVDVPATPGTAVVLARRHSTDVVRAGPTAIAEDSWDAPPAPVLDASSLSGRHARMPSRRTWIALVAVLVGLGAVVGVPFVLSSQPEAGPAAAAAPDESPTELDEPPPGFVPDPTYLQSAAPLSTGGAATPARSPSTQAQLPNPAAQNTTTAPDPPPPFAPLTIEAHIWVNYADVQGLNLVRNLGNWGGTPGTLTLDGIAFPSQGSYTITIYYVHPDGETNRSAQVTVSGVEPVTVNFVGNSNCCLTTAVTITVPAGTRSITFSNPTSHAPSIDKVIITSA